MQLKGRKLFLSGKTSGALDLNRDKFEIIKAKLVKLGFEVTTLIDVYDRDKSLTKAQHRSLYLMQIANSDALVVFDKWQNNPGGSKLDVFFALEYNIPVYTAVSCYKTLEDASGNEFIQPLQIKWGDVSMNIEINETVNENGPKLYIERK